ncbi:MAG: ABC transporter substrate-binding protein [Clostridiales bacterium]|nr:ABC transporter substrate-binding protein [Clostridiales bacterium]
MNKKLIATLLSAAMCLSLAACGQKTDAPAGSGSGSGAVSASNGEKTQYTVGICQLVQHVALDAATQGFIDALNEALPGQVTIENKNASGEPNNCATIVNGFVSEGVDLIMANATGALTAAASATADIPILGTSITAYGVALDIDNFSGTVGGNISGTSDLADLSKQADMILEWFPETQKVGLLFCSAEANSKYQIDEVAKHLADKGIETKEFAFTDTNDVASVTQAAADYSDVVYIPTDNTAASNTEAIANVLVPAGVPAICGEEGICSGCGVATLSISYYDLGVTTGKMAAKILTGEADISTMPIEYTDATPKYNAAMCEQLGITPVEGYTAIEG